MARTITMLTSAMGLALCLGLVFMPLGCGGSQGMGTDPSHGAGEGPTVPDSTISDLKDCANEGAGRLTEPSYTFQFDIEVTESGQAGRVKVKDSYPGDRGIESCMARALEGMPVPMFILTKMLSEQAVSPESRGLMGQALPIAAAGGVVGLAPVLIVAAGVTVLVFVTVRLAEEAVEAARRKRKVEKECEALFFECLGDRRQPEWNRDRFGDHKDCQSCLGECKRQGGWPEYKCPRPRPPN